MKKLFGRDLVSALHKNPLIHTLPPPSPPPPPYSVTPHNHFRYRMSSTFTKLSLLSCFLFSYPFRPTIADFFQFPHCSNKFEFDFQTKNAKKRKKDKQNAKTKCKANRQKKTNKQTHLKRHAGMIRRLPCFI